MSDTCNHPAKFRNDHRTFVLMGGCVWGHHRACWPRPSPFTTILCNFHQFWLVGRFLWVLKYVKALKKCDKWGRIKIIYKNNRFLAPLVHGLLAPAPLQVCLGPNNDMWYSICMYTDVQLNKQINTGEGHEYCHKYHIKTKQPCPVPTIHSPHEMLFCNNKNWLFFDTHLWCLCTLTLVVWILCIVL